MNLGILGARKDSGGIASITQDLIKHLKPHSALEITIGSRPVVYESATSRVPNVIGVTGRPSDEDVDRFLEGLDVVLAVETPYNWKAFEMARERGIRTVLCVMWEWLGGEIEQYPPDALWMPERWFLDDVRALGIPTAVIPYPVDRERFPFRRRERVEKYLSVLGHTGFGPDDRNGTACLLEAIKLSSNPHTRFLLRSIDELPDPKDSRIQYMADCLTDPSKLYLQGDLYLYPRRYAGLTLPIIEALSSGIPVIMPRMAPQDGWLPAHWLFPVTTKPFERMRRKIDICDPDPQVLANLIDRWAGRDIGAESDLAGQIAQDRSWEVLLPAVQRLLEGDMETPYFLEAPKKRDRKIALLGDFRFPWTMSLSVQRAMEDLGCETVTVQDEPNIKSETIETACEDADIFINMQMSNTTWRGPEAVEAQERIKKDNTFTASLNIDLYFGLERGKNNPSRDHPYWTTDLIFAADGGHKKEFAAMDFEQVHLPPGADASEAHLDRYDPGFGVDIAFVGTVPYPHLEWPFRQRMIDALTERYGERFGVWGAANGKLIRNGKLNRLYASVPIIIGDTIYSPNHWSDRYTEAMGRGAFLIAPVVPGIEKYYTPGKHFVGFNYNRGALTDFTPLFYLIDHYLAHPAEREMIRRAGFEHVRRNHTWRHRCEQMLDGIEELWDYKYDRERADAFTPTQRKTKKIKPTRSSRGPRIAFCGNFDVAWSAEAYQAATFEELGCEVVKLLASSTPPVRLLEVARECDVLLFTQILNYRYPDLVKAVGEAQAEGVPTVFFNMDLALGWNHRRESVTRDNPLWASDLVFSPDGGSDDKFKRLGINHHFMLPSVYAPEASKPGKLREEFDVDVAFVGTVKHHAEWPFRQRMVHALRARYGERFKTWGPDSPDGIIRNERLNDLYRTARVIAGCTGKYHPRYWTNRHAEVLGRGGVLVAPWPVPGLDHYYKLGEHYLGFDHKGGELTDFSEMFEKIDCLLDDRALAERIRTAGRAHVLEHHAYHRVLADVLEKIEAMLKAGSKPVPSEDISGFAGLCLGSGNAPRTGPGWTNVDIVDFGNNVIADLSEPWPFDDDSFDEVVAEDILEHLPDLVHGINEMIRVCKPGGSIFIRGPNSRYPEYARIDPEHRWSFSNWQNPDTGQVLSSLDYWDPDKYLCKSFGPSHHKGRFFIEGLDVREVNFNLEFRANKKQ